jgi:hypothetical protein
MTTGAVPRQKAVTSHSFVSRQANDLGFSPMEKIPLMPSPADFGLSDPTFVV